MEVLPPTGPDELGWSDNWHPSVYHLLINKPGRRASTVYTKEALFYFTLFHMFYFLMLIVGMKEPSSEGPPIFIMLRSLSLSVWPSLKHHYHCLPRPGIYFRLYKRFGSKPFFSCVSCNLPTYFNTYTFDPEDSLIWLLFPSDVMDLWLIASWATQPEIYHHRPIFFFLRSLIQPFPSSFPPLSPSLLCTGNLFSWPLWSFFSVQLNNSQPWITSPAAFPAFFFLLFFSFFFLFFKTTRCF